MKPLIGVTTNQDETVVRLAHVNIESVTRMGGTPVILPNITDHQDMIELALRLDGILVTGGGDVDPTLFGEEPHPDLGEICPARDQFEIGIVKEMLKLNKPIFAICRGIQVLNIAAGGSIYQDIYSQYDTQLLQHKQRAPRSHGSHYVNVQEDTLLHKIAGSTNFKVNSFHHEAVKEIADGFQVSANANDSVIEAIESNQHSFVVGVQWHPEYMPEDIVAKALFQAFLESCQKNILNRAK